MINLMYRAQQTVQIGCIAILDIHCSNIFIQGRTLLAALGSTCSYSNQHQAGKNMALDSQVEKKYDRIHKIYNYIYMYSPYG
jgi:hypothetical protein